MARNGLCHEDQGIQLLPASVRNKHVLTSECAYFMYRASIMVANETLVDASNKYQKTGVLAIPLFSSLYTLSDEPWTAP